MNCIYADWQRIYAIQVHFYSDILFFYRLKCRILPDGDS